MTPKQLQFRQALPLEIKIKMSKRRIQEYVRHFRIKNCFVSFSGGKDSTALLHLVRSLYPEIKGVFFNTGLEFPEVIEFVKQQENIETIRPKLSFNKVIEKYGYPVASKEVSQKVYEIRTTKSDKLRDKRLYGDERGNGKLPEKWKYLIDAPFKIGHQCCNALKKNPSKAYEKKGMVPIVGTMAKDSRLRGANALRHNCNVFDGRPMSAPLSFWTEEDIWGYIRLNNLDTATIYSKGYPRTGCVFCLYGIHLEEKFTGENRFQKMYRTHPKLWFYCMDKLGVKEVCDFMGIKTKPQLAVERGVK